MADDPQGTGGWLPPQAPGAQPPPRFSPPEFQPPVATPAARPVQTAPVPGAPAPGAPRGKTDPLAISALLLGLAGLLLLLMSLGFFFFFALPCSLGAWLAGSRSRRRFKTGRAQRGEGMAGAGRILGIIGSAIGLAATITWIVLLANGYTPESLQRDLERELERQQQQQQRQRETDAPEAVVQAWVRFPRAPDAVSAGAARAVGAASGDSPPRPRP